MSCFGINCIPTPDAYEKELVTKMKKTASEGGDIMEAHGKELIHAMTTGEFILNALHLHDVFAANKEYAQHLNRAAAEQLSKRPTVLPMGSLLEELRTSPVDLHHAVSCRYRI